jgi:hypothetical protein
VNTNSFQLAEWLTDNDVINSIINSKFIIDYGTIKSINKAGTLATIQHQVNANFNGKDYTLVTPNVEVLYNSNSSLSLNSPPQVGDGVILFGLRRFLQTTTPPLQDPVSQVSGAAYDRSTMKCFPLSTIGGQSLLTIAVVNGKLQVKNNTATLFNLHTDLVTAINNFNNSLSSGATSLVSTGSTPVPGSAMSFIVSACTALTLALNNLTLEIQNLLVQ